MKKIIAVLMIVTLVFALSMTTFAARSLTADEKKLLDELKGRNVLGQKITDADLVSLENYLMSTDKPIEAAEVDTIIADVDTIISIVKDSGVAKLSDLPQNIKDQVMDIANKASSVAGLSVSLNSVSGGTQKLSITDRSGTPVVIREQAIKKTGFSVDASSIAFISFAIVSVAVMSALVISTRKSSRKTLVANNG